MRPAERYYTNSLTHTHTSLYIYNINYYHYYYNYNIILCVCEHDRDVYHDNARERERCTFNQRLKRSCFARVYILS